jgi:penicillin-binding protein-related factor A (putative recombinase)
MEFYFLDESGDQGARGSKYLILTLVKLRSIKKALKIIKEARQHLTLKTKKRKWLEQHGGEIKFSTFPDKEYLHKIMKRLVN